MLMKHNMPLQLTRAAEPSINGQRAGASLLVTKLSADVRTQQCYYRQSSNGLCS